ncbi:MAG TPA: preprotein translocase subunit YajC [Thermotogae bacterium]|nr:preprotein translocase subunit YajC [Thermotogota bacterium]
MLIAIFALFYFIAILPQRRREKQHRQMVESIKRGDVVVTIGGVVGKVIDVRKDTLKIKSANVTELEVRKASIAGVVSRGSQEVSGQENSTEES